jgi:hypothetical protein
MYSAVSTPCDSIGINPVAVHHMLMAFSWIRCRTLAHTNGLDVTHTAGMRHFQQNSASWKFNKLQVAPLLLIQSLAGWTFQEAKSQCCCCS